MQKLASLYNFVTNKKKEEILVSPSVAAYLQANMPAAVDSLQISRFIYATKSPQHEP